MRLPGREWKALHRFIHLLSEQKAGTLDHWQHYPSQKLKEPASDEFCDVLQAYEKALNNEGFKVETARTYASIARKLLLFLEEEGIARIADMVSKRLQLQERIGMDIMEILKEVLGTEDIIVVIQGEHACMTMRGVKKPGSKTKTSALSGAFESNAPCVRSFTICYKEELWKLIFCTF